MNVAVAALHRHGCTARIDGFVTGHVRMTIDEFGAKVDFTFKSPIKNAMVPPPLGGSVFLLPVRSSPATCPNESTGRWIYRVPPRFPALNSCPVLESKWRP